MTMEPELPDATPPDPAGFDPMQEVDWAPPMALLWIATGGDVDAVRMVWGRWLEHAGSMVPVGTRLSAVAAWHETAANAAAQKAAQDAGAPVPPLRRFDVYSAEQDLLKALRNGRIDAYGVVVGGGRELVKIERRAWHKLTLSDQHQDTAEDEQGRSVFSSIVLDRDGVLAAFPANVGAIFAGSTEEQPGTLTSQKKQRRQRKPSNERLAIAAYMDQHPDTSNGLSDAALAGAVNVWAKATPERRSAYLIGEIVPTTVMRFRKAAKSAL